MDTSTTATVPDEAVTAVTAAWRAAGIRWPVELGDDEARPLLAALTDAGWALVRGAPAPDARPPVVIATPTITAGLVLRWYHTADDWRRHAEAVSASQHGVTVHAEHLHHVPAGWLNAAHHAHQLLAAGRRDDAHALATHEPTRLLGGDLRPIQRPAGGGTS